MKIRIRPAISTHVPVLRALIDASVRGLQAHDYTPAQIEGALASVYCVDTQLINGATYFVAEALSGGEPARAEPVIVGCGGWSKRKTLFGGDQWTGREADLLDPGRDAAKIRAFFVHPAWVRRGVGSMILEACETAAQAGGFAVARWEPLSPESLCTVRGYVAIESLAVPLANGEALPIVRMEKRP